MFENKIHFETERVHCGNSDLFRYYSFDVYNRGSQQESIIFLLYNFIDSNINPRPPASPAAIRATNFGVRPGIAE